MNSSATPIKLLSISQRYFKEKFLELTHRRTLDSFRVRLNNPRSILQELSQVLIDSTQNKIKNFTTIEALLEEADALLKVDNELVFSDISKSYLTSLIGEYLGHKGKPSQKSKTDAAEGTGIDAVKERKLIATNQLIYALRIVLKDNELYAGSLVASIRNEILRLKDTDIKNSPGNLDTLSRLTEHAVSELLQQGYAKSYLYPLVRQKLFGKDVQTDFDYALNFVEQLCTRQAEAYKVVFKIKISGGHQINLNGSLLLSDEVKGSLCTTNAQAERFLTEIDPKVQLVYVQVEGLDYFSVLKKARRQLNAELDRLHLGFSEANLNVYNDALVCGTLEPDKTQVHRMMYQEDGFYKNAQTLYEDLTQKVAIIQENRDIAKETRNKITSAIRYLRLGSESLELEQKYVNYWIGLEYIFSNYDITERTIFRMKEHFTNCHALIYVKRNLLEFHHLLKRAKVYKRVPGYNNDLVYLSREATYVFVIEHFMETHPLLGYRAYQYKQRIFGTKQPQTYIVEHQKNLTRHLTRCYRIRNEIVHEAAINSNIEVVTGNLRYYLTFVLNSLLDYLASQPIDSDQDGRITIDDFFIRQELKFKSLERSQYPLAGLLAVKSATEVFGS
ncbi:hypothetical protein ACFSUS_21920 [Spirosoma soli]|uniref:Apea-like HEPN domain-containing protein n=1 Tax=Spirosoma soli TaxID=1770529 RepID=A0ABW5M8N2_9BACT